MEARSEKLDNDNRFSSEKLVKVENKLTIVLVFIEDPFGLCVCVCAVLFSESIYVTESFTL